MTRSRPAATQHPQRHPASRGQLATGLLYWLYERRLRRQIQAGAVPRHIGIILDGNRRFARERGLTDPQAAYDIGAARLDDVLAWCIDLGIHAVTLWVLSIDNLKRSPGEVAAVLSAVEAKIAALAEDPLMSELRIRLKAAGRLALLPPSLRSVLRRAEEVTAGHDALTLVIAAGYGGREEIVDSVRTFIRRKRQEGLDLDAILDALSPAAIDANLYTAGLPELDLIIRTSGEIRLSGFLLWQSVRSELYFSDVNWPEFRRVDFLRAIRDYQKRQRRFGT